MSASWHYADLVIAAVSLGLFGGFAIKAMIAGGAFADPVRAGSAGGCGCGSSPFKGKAVWTFWDEEPRRAVFRSELIGNAVFLVKWLVLAYILQARLMTYVPASLIAGAVGGEGVVPIAVEAVVGMPAYLNGYFAPPLLAGLMEQGMSAGSAMAFMISGAVSCIPAMAAIWSLVKRSIFLIYIGLGITGAILSGLIFQMVI